MDEILHTLSRGLTPIAQAKRRLSDSWCIVEYGSSNIVIGIPVEPEVRSDLHSLMFASTAVLPSNGVLLKCCFVTIGSLLMSPISFNSVGSM